MYLLKTVAPQQGAAGGSDIYSLYNNKEYQEVVTSIHFVKIKTTLLQNPLDSNPRQQFLLRSSVSCYIHRPYALSTRF